MKFLKFKNLIAYIGKYLKEIEFIIVQFIN